MLRRKTFMLGMIILVLTVAVGALPAQAGPRAQEAGPASNAIQCVSRGSSGFGGGSYAAISRSGRLVFFESLAGDLVSGQVEDSWDTLMFDRASSAFSRVSLSSGSRPVYNSGTYTSPPAVSPDGRYVAFVSSASDLVSGDTNGMPDVFLRDRTARTTVRVSLTGIGGEANGPSFTPAVSADGRYVAFQSMASNLVSGDTNGMMDVFVRDLVNRTTRRISVNNSGKQGTEEREYGFPGVSISDGGRYIAFSYQYLPFPEQQGALGPSVYLYDQQAGTGRWVAYGTMPSISADGRRLVFVTAEMLERNDANDSADVYLWDQASPARFERISVPHSGGSAAGQEIYSAPDISDDGRYVVFESNAHLVAGVPAGMPNIYLRDRVLQSTMLVSRGVDGSPADGESHNPTIAGLGSTIAFNSDATNLVSDDGNFMGDVFIFTMTPAEVLPGTREYYLPYVR